MVNHYTPLAIDIFCGLGGWTEGLMAEGYYVVGFDNVQHIYGDHRYPAQLVIQDVLTLHGSQFKEAALIVASPPCQGYSYRAMPWKRAKALPPPDNSLFDACFRIQREASAAAGHHIPMVVENVCGAQKWVGRARWHYGSYYLWGDVPALMPMVQKAVKVPGLNWSGSDKPGSDKPGYVAQAFNDTAIKNTGGSWFGVAHNTTSGKGQNPDGRNDPRDHIKCGGDWYDSSESSKMRRHSLNSPKRRMASAMIAKIPFPLACHIARTWKPREVSYG
jgi:hypothetical protein